MTDRDKETVSRLKGSISADVHAHIRRMMIFGSRVRGEAEADSDLDLAVLVDELTPGLEHEIEEAAYSVMWDMDFNPIISLKVFTEARYRAVLAQGYSFYRNIEREGIAV